MSKKMLIDATHEEETRVVIIDGQRLDEFDYESKFRKPLKGSIFLAKVTRVEPSLQAAFVNFGGNRHGFLPFSEIHPDYFRIPIADREALLAEQEALIAEAEEAEAKEEQADLENHDQKLASDEQNTDTQEHEISDENDEQQTDDTLDQSGYFEGHQAEIEDEDHEDDEINGNIRGRHEDFSENNADSDIDESEIDDGPMPDSNESDLLAKQQAENPGQRHDRGRGRRGGRNSRGRNRRYGQFRRRNAEKYDEESNPEQRFRQSLRNRYKIQEVIKRGQIMLVQVSKEERGNKGAAVSTYLSLPGRYCVLMPNSPRAGGVSRKIANYQDRARMREIMKDMNVPKGMSVILRTAGVSRTKPEITRDLDYLTRLWDNIRELTLQSSAPSLIYEEADLIKRAVRDLYGRDVDEIIVSGEEGYQNAKNFMKMMIPSHVKKVKEYKDTEIPLLNKYKIEAQIAEIGETQVTLPSGGYLVINPTEALVSIDVNSGKATKQRHIEETALHTNLEAADEVARQLRLRDLGGLVVIDFIDMEDRRNNAKVEKRMRDALSTDRARVQMGRISNFGLMELSRQRLNPSLSESQFKSCPHCNGSGRIRTADAASIMVLRALEDEGMRGRAAQLIAHVANEVAQYILNNKRKQLTNLESRYNMSVLIRVDDEMAGGHFRVEVSKPHAKHGAVDSDVQDDEATDASAEDNTSQETTEKTSHERPHHSARRGRRRHRDRDRDRDTDRDRQHIKHGDSQVMHSSEYASQPETQHYDHNEHEDLLNSSNKENKDTQKEKPKTRGRKKPETRDIPTQDSEPQEIKQQANKPEPKKEYEPKEYEKVNEAPKEKKKGWWNKF